MINRTPFALRQTSSWLAACLLVLAAPLGSWADTGHAPPTGTLPSVQPADRGMGSDQATDPNAKQDADKAPAAQVLTPKKPLTDGDVSFLEEAQQASAAAIQGSRMALEKSHDDQVRTLAKQLLEQHSDTGSQLDALAKAKGVAVPSSPSLTQRAKLTILSMRDGSSFDQHFVDSIGVSTTEDAVDLFQKAATGSSDPDVRAFATDNLPALQHDLDLARTLKAAEQQQGIDE